jgi:hypothetical protein
VIPGETRGKRVIGGLNRERTHKEAAEIVPQRLKPQLNQDGLRRGWKPRPFKS